MLSAGMTDSHSHLSLANLWTRAQYTANIYIHSYIYASVIIQEAVVQKIKRSRHKVNEFICVLDNFDKVEKHYKNLSKDYNSQQILYLVYDAIREYNFESMHCYERAGLDVYARIEVSQLRD